MPFRGAFRKNWAPPSYKIVETNHSFPYNGTYPISYAVGGAFPSKFLWGVTSAAAQVEGGWLADGKGVSIWDTFSGATNASDADPHMARGNVSWCPAYRSSVWPFKRNPANCTTAVAAEMHTSYRLFRDIRLMGFDLGLRAYRFSISWARLLPTGRLAERSSRAHPDYNYGSVRYSKAGAAYYERLLDELHANKIEPIVTLFAWDLPQALHNGSDGGWLDPAIIPAFRACVGERGLTWKPARLAHDSAGTFPTPSYAAVCFRLFGKRVRRWITFSEPRNFCVRGYGSGKNAPGGDAANLGRNPYICAHNILLAHAQAAEAFRLHQLRAGRSKSTLGMTNVADWFEAADVADAADRAAAARALDWSLGWFADPVWRGGYPASMIESLGGRLPAFTPAERALLNRSVDYFSVSTYSAQFATPRLNPPNYGQPGGPPFSYYDDYEAETFHTGAMPRSSAGQYSAPWAMRTLLSYIHERYGQPPILIDGNGVRTAGEVDAKRGVSDGERVLYHVNYTSEVQRAVSEDGVDVIGYLARSFVDAFEWEAGYTVRSGLVYTDFTTSDAIERRTPKASARWLQASIRDNYVAEPSEFLVYPYKWEQHSISAWWWVVFPLTVFLFILPILCCAVLISRASNDPLAVILEKRARSPGAGLTSVCPAGCTAPSSSTGNITRSFTRSPRTPRGEPAARRVAEQPARLTSGARVTELAGGAESRPSSDSSEWSEIAFGFASPTSPRPSRCLSV